VDLKQNFLNQRKSNSMEKQKKEFTGSKLTKHFKIDKQTKRMLALGKFPGTVKISAKEQADQNVKLEPLTRNGFKSLMMVGQLSNQDSHLTGMNDPLWKPKKTEEASAEGEAGNSPTAGNKGRKGKKAIKMRTEKTEATTSGN
jgi:hypothetical protein